MSEVKWTPGPWSVRDCPNKGAETDLKDSGRIKLVSYNDGKYEGDLAIVQTEKSQANAHLIAAAPELYEALEKTTDELNVVIERVNLLLKERITSSDIQPPDYLDQQTVFENVALLAKARGEQP